MVLVLRQYIVELFKRMMVLECLSSLLIASAWSSFGSQGFRLPPRLKARTLGTSTASDMAMGTIGTAGEHQNSWEMDINLPLVW